MTAGTVAGGTLAMPALAAGVEAAPAVSTLLGKSGAAASAGAGQAYVRGSDAVAQGGQGGYGFVPEEWAADFGGCWASKRFYVWLWLATFVADDKARLCWNIYF